MLLAVDPAAAACRQALVLAMDVSGSVDPAEHALQRRGLAWALTDDEVTAAFLAIPAAPVRVYAFEWAGSFDRTDLVGWTEITSAGDLARVADRLVQIPRSGAASGTATGQALLYAGLRLAEQPSCLRHTIDISTDGVRNAGITPALARRAPELAEVVVNGLAIGSGRRPGDETRLTQLDRIVEFLHAEVLQGPGAFVETADDYHDFARAMQRKLLRELMTPVVGRAPGIGLGPG